MAITLQSYLAHKDRVESALRYLESLDLPVGPLWTAHSQRIDDLDRQEPTDEDRKYLLPVDQPTIPEHFDGKRPQLLDPSHLWPGYSYSLTSGQRAWLRENYGLTPTMTVTVLEVAAYAGTRHPRYLHLRSDIHIDPVRRRHVLINATIRSVGEFFTQAAKLTAEIEQAREAERMEKEAKSPKAAKSRKIVDLTSLLAELEADLAGV